MNRQEKETVVTEFAKDILRIVKALFLVGYQGLTVVTNGSTYALNLRNKGGVFKSF